ncbi:transcription factor Ouib [Drosophila ficusphila]|uniref:transcription factor Ouib n=1 Tax=Drosophila ficusphila TaxID=30025 RepID=UPI0007E5C676|nr:transcription factor Ouib [Drosophila ficusphila]
MSALRSVCRTCGKIVGSGRATKLFDKSNYNFISLIENITDMFLEFDKVMPHLICNGCKQMLIRVLAFRSKCLKVHQSFLATKKKLLHRKSVVVDQLDVEDEMDEEEIEDDGNQPEDLENDLEDEEVFLLKDFQEQDQEEDDELQEEVEYQEYLFQEKDEYMLNQSPKTIKKTHVRQSTQARRSTKTWICDQCGGVFKCSTYLKLHLLRHTGEKPFECDICQAKYYAENEMRRHRILHTDARPYACRFCGKTFRGCSSKVIHERSHTNERPFQCQHCDKAFTSTSTRQRHEMLHTNQRKYHCETCDQWFLRSTHLTIHQNTKLHKRRMERALNR